MNNIKEERKVKGFPWSVFILMVAVFIIIGALVCFQIPRHPEEEYLQDRIDNKVNVTDEYRLGWNDCVRALRVFNRLATNMTGSAT